MSEISLMITITDKAREAKFRELYKENGGKVSFVKMGRGTATPGILHSFGLDPSEKSIIDTMVTNETFERIKRALHKRYRIDGPGVGVVFKVPISSVGGKKQLSFLLNGQDFKKSEESTLKKTEFELIIAITNKGFTEYVMAAAREAGAGGGTTLHAKGTGMKASEKFFGFMIAEEKEMVYIVTRTAEKDKVMRSIMDNVGINHESQTICISLPVTDTVGMSHLIPEETELDELT